MTFIFKQVLHSLELDDLELWSSWFHLSSAGIIQLLYCARCMWCWRPNSEFHACSTSVLPTEPHPSSIALLAMSPSWVSSSWDVKHKRQSSGVRCYSNHSVIFALRKMEPIFPYLPGLSYGALNVVCSPPPSLWLLVAERKATDRFVLLSVAKST